MGDYLFMRLMFILVSVIIISLNVLLLLPFDGSKVHPFFIGIVSLIDNYKKTKWVYHDDLGFFISVFEDEKIIVYKQGFLYMKELFIVYNDGNVKSISNAVKNNLDEIYRTKVSKAEEQRRINDKIDVIKEWDGFLDTQSRRDGKIKQLLGK